jgi:hypothetical protein
VRVSVRPARGLAARAFRIWAVALAVVAQPGVHDTHLAVHDRAAACSSTIVDYPRVTVLNVSEIEMNPL